MNNLMNSYSKQMSFAVYILRCADNSYYTGHTDNLEVRFAQHQSGAIRGYAYERRPVELMWADHVPTREEALAAEMRIKGWSRAKKEAWIAKDWELRIILEMCLLLARPR